MVSRKTLVVLALILAPLFFSTAFAPLGENLRAGFFSVAKPFLSVTESVRGAFLDAAAGIMELVTLRADNRRLAERVSELETELRTLGEVGRENIRLRSLLDFRQNSGTGGVACQVIAREITPHGHWLALNKGSLDGLSKEMPVVSPGGLVGKVVEIGPQTAKVLLLTDMESRVSGMIQESRDTGLVAGDGTPFLKMRLIDFDAQAKIGDQVLSSGLGGVYPKGIPIGKIEALGKEKRGLHLYARLKPAVPFSRVEEVLCLRYRAQS